MKCETEVYGLVTGPTWLRPTLKQELIEMGYVQNPYDRCIYSLHGDHDMVIGNAVLDVDDLVEGGTGGHRKRMDRFYKNYKCGKQLRIKDNRDEGTLIVGRRVVQRDA